MLTSAHYTIKEHPHISAQRTPLDNLKNTPRHSCDMCTGGRGGEGAQRTTFRPTKMGRLTSLAGRFWHNSRKFRKFWPEKSQKNRFQKWKFGITFEKFSKNFRKMSFFAERLESRIWGKFENSSKITEESRFLAVHWENVYQLRSAGAKPKGAHLKKIFYRCTRYILTLEGRMLGKFWK